MLSTVSATQSPLAEKSSSTQLTSTKQDEEMASTSNSDSEESLSAVQVSDGEEKKERARTKKSHVDEKAAASEYEEEEDSEEKDDEEEESCEAYDSEDEVRSTVPPPSSFAAEKAGAVQSFTCSHLPKGDGSFNNDESSPSEFTEHSPLVKKHPRVPAVVKVESLPRKGNFSITFPSWFCNSKLAIQQGLKNSFSDNLSWARASTSSEYSDYNFAATNTVNSKTNQQKEVMREYADLLSSCLRDLVKNEKSWPPIERKLIRAMVVILGIAAISGIAFIAASSFLDKDLIAAEIINAIFTAGTIILPISGFLGSVGFGFDIYNEIKYYENKKNLIKRIFNLAKEIFWFSEEQNPLRQQQEKHPFSEQNVDGRQVLVSTDGRIDQHALDKASCEERINPLMQYVQLILTSSASNYAEYCHRLENFNEAIAYIAIPATSPIQLNDFFTTLEIPNPASVITHEDRIFAVERLEYSLNLILQAKYQINPEEQTDATSPINELLNKLREKVETLIPSNGEEFDSIIWEMRQFIFDKMLQDLYIQILKRQNELKEGANLSEMAIENLKNIVQRLNDLTEYEKLAKERSAKGAKSSRETPIQQRIQAAKLIKNRLVLLEGLQRSNNPLLETTEEEVNPVKVPSAREESIRRFFGLGLPTQPMLTHLNPNLTNASHFLSLATEAQKCFDENKPGTGKKRVREALNISLSFPSPSTSSSINLAASSATTAPTSVASSLMLCRWANFMTESDVNNVNQAVANSKSEGKDKELKSGTLYYQMQQAHGNLAAAQEGVEAEIVKEVGEEIQIKINREFNRRLDRDLYPIDNPCVIQYSPFGIDENTSAQDYIEILYKQYHEHRKAFYKFLKDTYPGFFNEALAFLESVGKLHKPGKEQRKPPHNKGKTSTDTFNLDQYLFNKITDLRQLAAAASRGRSQARSNSNSKCPSPSPSSSLSQSPPSSRSISAEQSPSPNSTTEAEEAMEQFSVTSAPKPEDQSSEVTAQGSTTSTTTMPLSLPPITTPPTVHPSLLPVVAASISPVITTMQTSSCPPALPPRQTLSKVVSEILGFGDNILADIRRISTGLRMAAASFPQETLNLNERLLHNFNATFSNDVLLVINHLQGIFKQLNDGLNYIEQINASFPIYFNDSQNLRRAYTEKHFESQKKIRDNLGVLLGLIRPQSSKLKNAPTYITVIDLQVPPRGKRGEQLLWQASHDFGFGAGESYSPMIIDIKKIIEDMKNLDKPVGVIPDQEAGNMPEHLSASLTDSYLDSESADKNAIPLDDLSTTTSRAATLGSGSGTYGRLCLSSSDTQHDNPFAKQGTTSANHPVNKLHAPVDHGTLFHVSASGQTDVPAVAENANTSTTKTTTSSFAPASYGANDNL